MIIPEGTPLADLLTAARSAFARGDGTDGDRWYEQAWRLASTTELRIELAVEHVAKLLDAEQPTLARRRVDEYLRALGDRGVLLVQRAEVRSKQTDHTGAVRDAAAARATGERLSDDDTARLLRVEGLAAADRGDHGTADRLLAEARRIFHDAADHEQVAAVDQDRIALATRRHEPAEVPATARTVADHLLLALALKRRLRYDEALQVLLGCVADLDVDPALRHVVLLQITVLLWLTHQDDAAKRMREMLTEAVASSPDPVAAQAEVDRVFPDLALPDSGTDRLEHARRLVAANQLDAAERLLAELRDEVHGAPEVANWHLTAGELELAHHEASGGETHLHEAAKHLATAADRANTVSLAELKVFALRLTGRALQRLGEDDEAVRYWVEAHRIEEHIARLQVTDDLQVRMLLAAPDEHDERIRAAAEAVDRVGPLATAGIVVAMEGARGATILDAILPGTTRALPRLSDHEGAWRWLAEMTRGLPKSQVVWMTHATPHGVHHAVIGRKSLRHRHIAIDLDDLDDAVNDLKACCSTKDFLEESVRSGDFDRCLDQLAELLEVGAVVDGLGPGVRRIAIVANGVLGDIPFAGLLGHRFALSDLPCLSARKPLRRRSIAQRGDHALRGGPLTRAADRDSVTDPEALRDELARLRHQTLRIDSHGTHDEADPARSWLQLAAGQLNVEDLKRLNLRACGTVMLGACESGMTQPRGRDERVGFVRAAVRAGAASVLAARWVADDDVAAEVLDRFERYLRFLPRDVALQRALLGHGHPAWWACWSLYGDSGWQTRATPLRRLVRRKLDEWRHRVA